MLYEKIQKDVIAIVYC